MKLLQHGIVRIALALAANGLAIPAALAQTYVFTELATPDRANSVARGLSDSGNSAGRSGTTFSTKTKAFVSRGGNRFELIGGGGLPEGDYSSAFGINDRDEVVGGANTGASLQAFLWDPSRGMQLLGTLPGDNASQAFAINNRGEVVGYSSGPTGTRAFIWTRNGGIESLGVLPGGTASMAFAISTNGRVVGKSTSTAGVRGFYWAHSRGMRDLGVLPGHTESHAMGVNENGTVVGFSGDGQQSQGFVWDERSGMSPLERFAGGLVSRALAVNNRGDIVGFSTGPDHGYHAVFWDKNGKVFDLNKAVVPAGAILLLEAHAVNSSGQILAYGFRLPLDPDGHEKPGRMFLLTPVGPRP
ncbi:MAG TPA: hypothetical protein VHM00_02660 [Caldimonas sp.]|jgi:probable HAF family extracellular repeat protein|nr:hypothetical protein [Caldimonas sp.]HEX2539963.1 hypothetical protein [Caldimonas sp.]